MPSSIFAVVSAVMALTLAVTAGAIVHPIASVENHLHARGIHEIVPAAKTSWRGKIGYLIVALLAFALLIYCFIRRSKNLNVNSLRNMNTLRLLVIIIYILGICFVISGMVLQLGLGLTDWTRCNAAIDLCLVFYVGGKVVVYVFLVERAHAIRAARYRRFRDWIWIVSMLIVLAGFGTIAVFAFLRPVVDISELDGQCRIGLPFEVTLPLLIYDIVMNVGMTLVFFGLVKPFLRRTWRNYIPAWLRRSYGRLRSQRDLKAPQSDPAQGGLDGGGMLEKLAMKSLLASLAILISTVVNLSLLFALRGRELGWLCYMVCTIDVTWGVLVIHVVTADPAELDSAPRSSNASATRRSGFSLADDDLGIGGGSAGRR